jgi:fumarate reductase flavoprotein subunit
MSASNSSEGKNTMEKITRRSFVGGAGAFIATSAAVLAATGCSPQTDTANSGSSGSEGEGQVQGDTPIAPDEVIDVDVVVVGAGCSGLAAAVQAAETRAKVVCLDTKAVMGGAAGGIEGVFGVGSKLQAEKNINADVGELIRHEMEQNQYRNSTLVLRDLVKFSGEDIDWLVEHGVRFGTIDNYVGTKPIFHWFETLTGAESYVVPMEEAARAAGVEFILDTHADSLIQEEDGSVVGIYATKSNATVLQVNAKAVILATGGYAERLDYLSDLGFSNENATYGAMGCDGSGHDMAMAAGGVSYRMTSGILGRLQISGLPAFYEGGYFNSVMNSITASPDVVWVNQDGERFVNEDLSQANPMITANPCRRHEKVFILTDEAWMNGYINNDQQGLADQQSGLDKGIILKADSWADLAQSAGMDAEVLRATIAQYNENCTKGTDSDFGKAAVYLRPFATEGVVYAVAGKTEVGKTMGSIQTDRDFRVIGKDGSPIIGLYAIGVEGAMIWSGVYTMNISGSCAAHNVYSGRTAARHATLGL